VEGALSVLYNLGLPGVVILGLALTVFHLWKRSNALTDARLADAKASETARLEAERAHAAELRELSLDYARLAERVGDVIEDFMRRRE
jgi:hypothetical protein